LPKDVIQRGDREKRRIIVDLKTKKCFIIDGTRVVELEEKGVGGKSP
jgi:hypothetical protein